MDTVTNLNVEQMELGHCMSRHLVTLGNNFMKLDDLADLILFLYILQLLSLITVKPTNYYLHKLSKRLSSARRLFRQLRIQPAFLDVLLTTTI